MTHLENEIHKLQINLNSLLASAVETILSALKERNVNKITFNEPIVFQLIDDNIHELITSITVDAAIITIENGFGIGNLPLKELYLETLLCIMESIHKNTYVEVL